MSKVERAAEYAAEAGRCLADAVREYGVSRQAITAWLRRHRASDLPALRRQWVEERARRSRSRTPRLYARSQTDRWFRLYQAGWSPAQIAAADGVARQSVYTVLRRYRSRAGTLPAARRRPPDSRRVVRAVAELIRGRSLRQVALACEMSHEWVRAVRAEAVAAGLID